MIAQQDLRMGDKPKQMTQCENCEDNAGNPQTGSG
jgi:hypothetical protein